MNLIEKDLLKLILTCFDVETADSDEELIKSLKESLTEVNDFHYRKIYNKIVDNPSFKEKYISIIVFYGYLYAKYIKMQERNPKFVDKLETNDINDISSYFDLNVIFGCTLIKLCSYFMAYNNQIVKTAFEVIKASNQGESLCYLNPLIADSLLIPDKELLKEKLFYLYSSLLEIRLVDEKVIKEINGFLFNGSEINDRFVPEIESLKKVKDNLISVIYDEAFNHMNIENDTDSLEVLSMFFLTNHKTTESILSFSPDKNDVSA